MVQETNKNIVIAKKFKKKISNDIKVDRFILFGSRAKGTFAHESDFDILIVSKSFREKLWYKRPRELYLAWKEDKPLELLCYTPEEAKKRKGKMNILSEALKTGIEI